MNGLRNVVWEEELRGLGQCYIYDDGSHCPKQIDGEPVNPKWGLTKAGRPRKRAPKPKAGPRNSRRSPDLDSGYCGSRSSEISQSSTSQNSFNSGRSSFRTPVPVALDIDMGDILDISEFGIIRMEAGRVIGTNSLWSQRSKR